MFFAKSMPIVVIFMMGASLGQVVALTLPLWHIDAASGGGVHPITFDISSAQLSARRLARQFEMLEAAARRFGFVIRDLR